MLNYSLCDLPANVGIELVDAVQITLAAFMCLLVAARFVRESVQMYSVAKCFQLNRYINLLVKEGMIYFLSYVHVPSLYFLVCQTDNIVS